MKQYMLAVLHDVPVEEIAAGKTPEQMQEIFQAVDAFNAELQAADAWVFGGGLNAPADANTLRVEAGKVVVTDGPFTETKEFLGGFWVIKAADRDAALAWARKATVACAGIVEVRPFQDEAGD
jgi:hypothetical protein